MFGEAQSEGCRPIGSRIALDLVRLTSVQESGLRAAMKANACILISPKLERRILTFSNIPVSI